MFDWNSILLFLLSYLKGKPNQIDQSGGDKKFNRIILSLPRVLASRLIFLTKIENCSNLRPV